MKNYDIVIIGGGRRDLQQPFLQEKTEPKAS